MRSRRNRDEFQFFLNLSCQQINLCDPVDLVAEKLNSDRDVALIGRHNLKHIPVHAEGAAVKINLVPLILNIDQVTDHVVPVALLPRAERNDHPLVVLRAAQTVNAGNRRNHNDILPLDQRRRGGKPEFIDLLIPAGILLDIGIRRGHIRLRLVVVVIGHEIFHGVLRKEFPELAVKLCRQCLVVRDDQGRFLQSLDHVRHGECLARTGHAEQCLRLISFLKSAHQLLDGLRLITCRLILRMKSEFHDSSSSTIFFAALNCASSPESLSYDTFLSGVIPFPLISLWSGV